MTHTDISVQDDRLVIDGAVRIEVPLDPDTALDLAGHLLDFAIEELRDERRLAEIKAAEAEQREHTLQVQLDKITDRGY